jgi:molybdopterin-binding protein
MHRGSAYMRSRLHSTSIGGQHITSIISADAVREVQLQRGQMAIARMKSIEVIIVQFV